MTDQDQIPDGAAGESADAIRLNVLGQYIKDLSFESPNAPRSLQSPGTNPRLEVSVNVHARGLGPDVYEVALNLEAHARNDEGIVYTMELVYAGTFRLENVPEDKLQPLLFIDCASILFPFGRRLIADLARDGGFPPLMLDPIDFRLLYHRNLANAQEEAGQAPKN